MLPTLHELTIMFNSLNLITFIGKALCIIIPLSVFYFNRKYRKIESPNNWKTYGAKITVISSIVATTMSASTMLFLSVQYSELLEVENYQRYKNHRTEFIERINQSIIHPDKFAFINCNKLYSKIFPYNMGGRLDILPAPLIYNDQVFSYTFFEKGYIEFYRLVTGTDYFEDTDPNYEDLNGLIGEVSELSRTLNKVEHYINRLNTIPANNRKSELTSLTNCYNTILIDSLKAANILGLQFPSAEKHNPQDQIEKLALLIEQIFESYNTIIRFTNSPLKLRGSENIKLKLFYLKHAETIERKINRANKTASKAVYKLNELIQFLILNYKEINYASLFGDMLIEAWINHDGSNESLYRQLEKSNAGFLVITLLDYKNESLRFSEKGFKHFLAKTYGKNRYITKRLMTLVDELHNIIPEEYQIKNSSAFESAKIQAIKRLERFSRYYTVDDLVSTKQNNACTCQ